MTDVIAVPEMVSSVIENHSPFVSGRTVRNGISHWLIGALLLLCLAPFVLVMSYITTAGLYELGNVGSQIVASLTQVEQHYHKQGVPADSPVHESPGQSPKQA